jgi:hypothetical protein
MSESYRDVRIRKQRQLEREIHESAATAREKANMLHSLSKVGIFAGEEAAEARREGKAAGKTGILSRLFGVGSS